MIFVVHTIIMMPVPLLSKRDVIYTYVSHSYLSIKFATLKHNFMLQQTLLKQYGCYNLMYSEEKSSCLASAIQKF